MVSDSDSDRLDTCVSSSESRRFSDGDSDGSSAESSSEPSFNSITTSLSSETSDIASISSGLCCRLYKLNCVCKNLDNLLKDKRESIILFLRQRNLFLGEAIHVP